MQTINTTPSQTATHRDSKTTMIIATIATATLTLHLAAVLAKAESATYVVRPSSSSATIVPGQPLHFECAQIGHKEAQFIWLKRPVTGQDSPMPEPILLEPNTDDTIEIHNERLTLLKPNYQSVGDYMCRDVKNVNEVATIKVRALPYIDDFGVHTSHTGKSAVVADGERLVLTCHVRDESVPVNITWLRSDSTDDEFSMVWLPDTKRASFLDEDPYASSAAPTRKPPFIQTYTSPGNIIVESVDKFTKRLVIESVGQEHRGYYSCMVDNGVTERSRKTIFIRVKDSIVALWPFLGIVAELFILFTIIYVWETQRAQKALDVGVTGSSLSSGTPAKLGSHLAAGTSKRPASGPSNAFESVPLNR